MWPFRSAPMVSVILASYQHARFVRQAATSVLGQTLGDLELIVVDDGSTDGTPDVVAELRDPRLSLVRCAPNRAVHPRNLALARAQGRYVAFQNSEDVWLPGKLAAQVDAMRRDPGATACFTAVTIVGADGRPDPGTWAEGVFATATRPSATWLRHFFDVGNCLSLPTAMVRRADLAALGGFRASLVQLSDFDLWIRLAALGEFVVLPERLTEMRVLGSANLSAPDPRRGRRSAIEHAVVLGRYLEPAALARFEEIFPELAPMPGTVARKVALALSAYRRGGPHRLFADRTMADILDDADERAAAVAAHGIACIETFLERRCDVEIRVATT